MRLTACQLRAVFGGIFLVAGFLSSIVGGYYFFLYLEWQYAVAACFAELILLGYGTEVIAGLHEDRGK